MPRRAKVERRVLAPDARYNSELVTRFINKVMQRGKKGARRADRLRRASTPSSSAPAATRSRSSSRRCYNATPVIEVKPRRVGGATYQVPVQIEGERRQSLAIRWLLTVGAQPGRQVDAGEARQRAARRLQQHRRHDQAARRHAPHGRGQPGLLALRTVLAVSYQASGDSRRLTRTRRD